MRPYGYRFVRKTDNALAHWEVDPQEAEIVRMILDLYVNKRIDRKAQLLKHLESRRYSEPFQL